MKWWFALALLLPAPAAAEAPADTLWAGYQVVTGSKRIPILGNLQTRTRTWFLARWREDEGGATLTRRVCGVAVDPVMGVEVRLPAALLANLPVSRMRFDLLAEGLVAVDAEEGWGREDLDRDGRPGVTIEVDAPLCGGKLYVASRTTANARAERVGDTIEGRIGVRVEQEILGASATCLRATADDTEDQMLGWFRLLPVPDDATCASWPHAAWPARIGAIKVRAK